MRAVLALLVGSWVVAPALAQLPPSPPLKPASPYIPPPPLFVRIGGPPGMKATFFRGQAKGILVEAPGIVGLRPGYTYRVALSDVPGFPGRVFYPTLEVRASLYVGNRARNIDFPAALNFTNEDFARANAGALVRKVIVLETPDRAIPVAAKANDPLEVRVPASGNLFAEANDHGQPLVLVQMGEREMSVAEAAASGVPGTVLLPGEKVMGSPRLPPTVPWTCFPVVDPVAGPIDPHAYNCLPDGGDVGMPVGVGPDGKLRGLDPSDTIAEYTDSKGRRRISVSNRVCLIVPRFVIVRTEMLPTTSVGRVGIGRAIATSGFDVVAAQQGSITQSQKTMLEQAKQKARPSGTLNLAGTAIVGRVRGLEIRATLRSLNEVNGLCLGPEQDAPELPLHIIKWPDKTGASIGDVVTFTLRYTNRGGQPIADVVVTDSLTPRFEYVAGSAKTDRAAIFTTQPNDAGSTILRWQFNDTLQPRESGTVTFQVRIR